MVLTPANKCFREAESVLREFLRWALRARPDLRTSALLVFGNCATLQLLCHKLCWRFFRSL